MCIKNSCLSIEHNCVDFLKIKLKCTFNNGPGTLVLMILSQISLDIQICTNLHLTKYHYSTY